MHAVFNILLYTQGCSERNISCVVKQHQGAKALRAAHAAFLLSHLVRERGDYDDLGFVFYVFRREKKKSSKRWGKKSENGGIGCDHVEFFVPTASVPT